MRSHEITPSLLERARRHGLENPVDVRFGAGCAAEEVAGLAEPPVLLVGSRRAVAAVAWARDMRETHDVANVAPNPTPDAIAAAHAMARAISPRTVIGLGGGSALDIAKIVAAYANRREFDPDAQDGLVRAPRLIQVPTTAGTGSEVTPWASYWLPSGEKRSIDHPACWADVAIVDPELSASMGPRLTLTTGLDAFAHAVESIWGRHATPAADEVAVAALRLIRAHLAAAVAGPTPADRESMALAALYAGAALSQCRSAAAHALSYALTGKYGVEHGLAVGLLTRALLPAVADRAPDRMALVLGALEAPDVAAAAAFVDEAIAAAGLRSSLAAQGVPEAAWPELAAAGLGAGRFANQPGSWTHDDVLAALRRIA